MTSTCAHTSKTQFGYDQHLRPYGDGGGPWSREMALILENERECGTSHIVRKERSADAGSAEYQWVAVIEAGATGTEYLFILFI